MKLGLQPRLPDFSNLLNTCLTSSIRITQGNVKITNTMAFKPLNFLIEKIWGRAQIFLRASLIILMYSKVKKHKSKIFH